MVRRDRRDRPASRGHQDNAARLVHKGHREQIRSCPARPGLREHPEPKGSKAGTAHKGSLGRPAPPGRRGSAGQRVKQVR